MILGLGVPEILIILVIVLLIFGPKNLPKLGKSLGKTVKNVREGMEEGEAEAKSDSKDDPKIETPAEDVKVEPAAEAQPEPVAAGASRVCPDCGASVGAGAKFCESCGHKF